MGLPIRYPNAADVVGPQIEIHAGGLITIENGTTLVSSSGKVSKAPIELTIDDNPPGNVVSPDRSQDLLGYFGGPNTDVGENFELTIRWDEILEDVGPENRTIIINYGNLKDQDNDPIKIKMGYTIIVDVASGGAFTATAIPNGIPNVVELLLSREYSNTQLNRNGGPSQVIATITVGNDENIRLEDSRTVEGSPNPDDDRDTLNETIMSVATPVGGVVPLVGAIPTAFEPPAVIPPLENVATPPLRATPPPVLSRHEEVPFRGGEVVQPERRFFIVKIAPNGEEEDRTELLAEDLSNLSELLTRLKDEKLPNGRYRILLEEPGSPTRTLMDFIKSQDTIGRPVRESGRGSNPITGEDAPAHQQKPQAVPVPPAASDGDAEQPGDQQPDDVSESSEGRSHFMMGAAVLAGAVLATDSIGSRWDETLDRAMEQSPRRLLTKVGRLCRRLRG